jgi:hypothetical protein
VTLKDVILGSSVERAVNPTAATMRETMFLRVNKVRDYGLL